VKAKRIMDSRRPRLGFTNFSAKGDSSYFKLNIRIASGQLNRGDTSTVAKITDLGE
jgi:hypothetical protein